MKFSDLEAAEDLRKHREQLRQLSKLVEAGSRSALYEAIGTQPEIQPVIRAIVLHQLSWSDHEAGAKLRELGVDLGA